MFGNTFLEYVKHYKTEGFLSIPNGLSEEQFAECLALAHNNNFESLKDDHQKIYTHWTNLNAERKFGYNENYLDGKPAEKLSTFGTHANFNGKTEWYKEYLEPMGVSPTVEE